MNLFLFFNFFSFYINFIFLCLVSTLIDSFIHLNYWLFSIILPYFLLEDYFRILHQNLSKMFLKIIDYSSFVFFYSFNPFIFVFLNRFIFSTILSVEFPKIFFLAPFLLLLVFSWLPLLFPSWALLPISTNYFTCLRFSSSYLFLFSSFSLCFFIFSSLFFFISSCFISYWMVC